jgi:TonB family protein
MLMRRGLRRISMDRLLKSFWYDARRLEEMSLFNAHNMVKVCAKKSGTLILTVTPFLLLYIAVAPCAYAQHRERVPEWWALYTEAQARWDAHNTVMPEYPEEAVRQRLAGVVQIKIAKDKYGRVAKIKIQPGVDLLLTKAIVKAVKQWTFKPRPDPKGSDRYFLSRLTFSFFISYGEGHVEMYTPPPGEEKIGERLNDADSNKELREWKEWEQVWERPADPPREE